MAVEWSSFGPELLLRLDRTAPGATLGGQLQTQLREAIQSGRLAGGERLPSTRALAAELGVSRGLVVDTYAQLEAEGYLDARPGAPTRVSACAVATPAPPSPAAVDRTPAIDFPYGEPDPQLFPMRDWLWALGEASREPPAVSLGNQDKQGVPMLREVVAAYLRRVRGSVVEADQIVVCSGFAQGLGLAASVLAARGIDVVAVEDPHPLSADLTLARAGQAIVPVPVDGDGIDVAALEASSARAVLLTPAHQCPTGVLLAPERRRALVAWAQACDGYLIEDDYDAEFRYDRQPVGSLQGLAPDRVIAISSVSKSLAPSLRLGWIASPCDMTAALTSEKEIADRGSPGLDQLALAHLVRSGRYDRHLRAMRAVYRERRDALVTALTEHAPAVEVSGLAAGFHAVLRLPEHCDEDAIVAAARDRGIGLYGMREWRTDATAAPPALVLGFGAVTPSSIRHAIASIADLLH